MKKLFLYLALIVLIILLFLPLLLRLFAKNLYEKPKKKEDTVEILKCTSLNESISTTYLNSFPYNFLYIIKGNYSNNLNSLDDSSISNKEIINDINEYSNVSYKENEDITEFRININEVNNNQIKSKYAQNIDNQLNFYKQKGFSCTKENI